MIIFVGDKPSAKNYNQSIPFMGTESYVTLMGWIGKMQVYFNGFDIINKDELESRMSSSNKNKYVLLGNEAEKVFNELTKMPHFWERKNSAFKLPHPSGLNRKLNDKKWLNKELNKCRRWLSE